jgi:hypothetical protein
MRLAGAWMTEKHYVPQKSGLKFKDFEGLHAPACQKHLHILG